MTQNEYKPWEVEGISEADYWRRRYIEAQQRIPRLVRRIRDGELRIPRRSLYCIVFGHKMVATHYNRWFIPTRRECPFCHQAEVMDKRGPIDGSDTYREETLAERIEFFADEIYTTDKPNG